MSGILAQARRDAERAKEIGRRLDAYASYAAQGGAVSMLKRPAGTAPDEAAELHRLAGLPPITYEREREAAARELGVRTTTLDAEVKKLRPKAEAGANTQQGRGMIFDEVKPWPETVSGAELLDEVAGTFTRYLALPAKAATALALWVAHAHAFEAFSITPRLNVTAPEKGCGKTLLLDVLQTLTPKALRTENVTTAVLFRLVDEHVPTLLVDEYDTFLRDNEDLRGALNAGHRRGGVHLRCVGDSNEVRAFRTFAPVALAGIRELPGTLRDRSIIIRMSRAKPGEIPERFDSRRIEREMTLRRKLARFAADHAEALAEIEPELPAGLYNREADNWRPLAAIAEVAGNGWPEKLHAAITALRDTNGDSADSIGPMLLDDMRALFNTLGSDWIASANACEHLSAIESRPWPEWGRSQKPITPRALARILGAFDIKPKAARRDGVSAGTRGYFVTDFEEAFTRYLLPPGSPSATPQQSHDTGLSSDSRSATGREGVADSDARKPAPEVDCCSVALGTTQAPDEANNWPPDFGAETEGEL